MEKPEILDKLLAFQIGEASIDLSFSRRLGRENAWGRNYSERIIVEYRKFIFLAYTSGGEVTPSDAVDQAWHLHLSYTDSYWNDLCRETLGKKIHHNPTLGGSEQQQIFSDQYLYTLTLYEDIFKEKPPTDIWPNPHERFKDAESFIRINRSRNWLIPKPNSYVTNFIASLGMASLLAACTNIQMGKGEWFWLFVIVSIAIVIVLLTWLVKKLCGNPDKSKGDGGCNAGCGGCGG